MDNKRFKFSHKIIFLFVSLMFLILVSGCQENYTGPVFIGLTTSKEINSNDLSLNQRNIIQLFNRNPNVYSFNKSYPQNLNANERLSVSDQTYIVIQFEQPSEVQDIFEIISLVLEYPDGSSKKWSPNIREFNDPNSRSWYSNSNHTEIYIPITTPSVPNEEGYKYRVNAIKFIDGNTINDVRFAANTSDYVLLFPSYDDVLFYDIHFLGLFDVENNRAFLSFESATNNSNIRIKRIWIADELVLDSVTSFRDSNLNSKIFEFSIEMIDETKLSSSWLYAEVEFENNQVIKGYLNKNINIENFDRHSITVFSTEDFYNLPKDISISVNLQADIIIDNSFVPFNNSIVINSEVKWDDQAEPIFYSISFLSNDILFYSNDIETCELFKIFNYAYCAPKIAISNILIIGNLIMENRMSVPISFHFMYSNYFLYRDNFDFDFEIISLNGNFSIHQTYTYQSKKTQLVPQHYIYRFNE